VGLRPGGRILDRTAALGEGRMRDRGSRHGNWWARGRASGCDDAGIRSPLTLATDSACLWCSGRPPWPRRWFEG
jgi:hypothetical protein